MDRLAALEAEVKADADAQRARKEAALAKAREQRARETAARDELRARQAAIATKDRGRARKAAEVDHGEGLGDALALVQKAHGVKQELARTPGKGEKSWIKSGLASFLLGPIGWLYAGSLREAVPATAAWLAFAALASKITFLLLPVIMVALPLSGIAGVVYALQYNRTGSRQHLFDRDKPAKQLPDGDA
jgi:hypothetical protein